MSTYAVLQQEKQRYGLGRALRTSKKGCFGTYAVHDRYLGSTSATLQAPRKIISSAHATRVFGGFVSLRFQISCKGLLSKTGYFL